MSVERKARDSDGRLQGSCGEEWFNKGIFRLIIIKLTSNLSQLNTETKWVKLNINCIRSCRNYARQKAC